jgi:hypothetical protein
MRKNLFKAVLYVCVLIAAILGAIILLAELMLLTRDRKIKHNKANRMLGYHRSSSADNTTVFPNA